MIFKIWLVNTGKCKVEKSNLWQSRPVNRMLQEEQILESHKSKSIKKFLANGANKEHCKSCGNFESAKIKHNFSQ